MHNLALVATLLIINFEVDNKHKSASSFFFPWRTRLHNFKIDGRSFLGWGEGRGNRIFWMNI
jgi:hypothetical protein